MFFCPCSGYSTKTIIQKPATLPTIYIIHSNKHNTLRVRCLIIKEEIIDPSQPIHSIEIVYTQMAYKKLCRVYIENSLME